VQMVEPVHSEKNHQKPVHRDTASTAALDELQSSMNDLDRDTSGYYREEKVDRVINTDQCKGEIGILDVGVPQMTPCGDDDESSEIQEVPPGPPTPSDRAVTAAESAQKREVSTPRASGTKKEDDVVHDESYSVHETQFRC
jgi:hypothetical protein